VVVPARIITVSVLMTVRVRMAVSMVVCVRRPTRPGQLPNSDSANCYQHQYADSRDQNGDEEHWRQYAAQHAALIHQDRHQPNPAAGQNGEQLIEKVVALNLTVGVCVRMCHVLASCADR
jgi:hypothetical protein